MTITTCARCGEMDKETFAYDSNGTIEEAKRCCRECVLMALREDQIEEKLERCVCGGRVTYPWHDPGMVAQIFSEGIVFWECENGRSPSGEIDDSLTHVEFGMYLAQPEADRDAASEWGDWNG